MDLKRGKESAIAKQGFSERKETLPERNNPRAVLKAGRKHPKAGRQAGRQRVRVCSRTSNDPVKSKVADVDKHRTEDAGTAGARRILFLE